MSDERAERRLDAAIADAELRELEHEDDEVVITLPDGGKVRMSHPAEWNGRPW